MGYVNTVCCTFTIESVGEKNWKSVNIWGSYGQEFNVLFFDSRCRVVDSCESYVVGWPVVGRYGAGRHRSRSETSAARRLATARSSTRWPWPPRRQGHLQQRRRARRRRTTSRRPSSSSPAALPPPAFSRQVCLDILSLCPCTPSFYRHPIHLNAT